jgi:hypothetical protein
MNAVSWSLSPKPSHWLCGLNRPGIGGGSGTAQSPSALSEP